MKLHDAAAPADGPWRNVMNVKEVAQYLRLHRSTIFRLLKEGKIPAFRIGSDWRFNREQIDEWRIAQEKATE